MGFFKLISVLSHLYFLISTLISRCSCSVGEAFKKVKGKLELTEGSKKSHFFRVRTMLDAEKIFILERFESIHWVVGIMPSTD